MCCLLSRSTSLICLHLGLESPESPLSCLCFLGGSVGGGGGGRTPPCDPMATTDFPS